MKRVLERNVGTSAFLSERHMWSSSPIPLPTPTQSKSRKSSSDSFSHMCMLNQSFSSSFCLITSEFLHSSHTLNTYTTAMSSLLSLWAELALWRQWRAWEEITANTILNKVYCPGVWLRERSFTHLCWLAPLTYGNSSMEKKNAAYNSVHDFAPSFI